MLNGYAGRVASAVPASEITSIEWISGADRYEVASNVAAHLEDPDARDLLVIASGATYPDVLSAVPLTVVLHASLLSAPDHLPPGVVSYIEKRQPNQVWIVGGENSVSASVHRPAYVATGRNFPDDLSAGPVASQAGNPVLLVHGACHEGCSTSSTALGYRVSYSSADHIR